MSISLLLMMQGFLFNETVRCSMPNNDLKLDTDVKRNEYLLSDNEISDLAYERLQFQKKTLCCNSFIDFKSYFSFFDESIQRIDYKLAITLIEIKIFYNFNFCCVSSALKDFFNKHFIKFFYLFGEKEDDNDDTKLFFYKEKANMLIKLTAYNSNLFGKVYYDIEKCKNDTEKLKTYLHSDLAIRFQNKLQNNSDTLFRTFLCDFKFNLLNFFTDRLILDTNNILLCSKEINYILKTLFNFFEENDIHSFDFIAFDSKEKDFFLSKEQIEFKREMIDEFNKLKNEILPLVVKFDFIIISSFFTMLIQDSDFAIFFVDERYHEKFVFLIQTYEFILDDNIFIKKDTAHFAGLIFNYIVETLIPGFLDISENLQNFSNNLKIKEKPIENFIISEQKN
ncbi:hypothetical protein GVAV_000576 [Gurleya vavrai]